MGNPLAQLMALLQGSPMSRLPSEPQGVRPGFGLAGAGVQPSDLMDKLRQPENWKMAQIPDGPFALKYGNKIVQGAVAVPKTSAVTGRQAYDLLLPIRKGGEPQYIETLSEKELERMIAAATK